MGRGLWTRIIVFDGWVGGGRVGKKTRRWWSDPSSILLLSVGAISRSDGKIRSSPSSLNCLAAAPLCFLFRLWLGFVVGPRPEPCHKWHIPTRARNAIGQICDHGRKLAASDDLAMVCCPSLRSKVAPPQHPHDCPSSRWWGFPPPPRQASRYGPVPANHASTSFSKNMKQGPRLSNVTWP